MRSRAYVDAAACWSSPTASIAHIMTLFGFEPNEDKLDLNGFLEPLGLHSRRTTFTADEAEAAVSNASREG